MSTRLRRPAATSAVVLAALVTLAGPAHADRPPLPAEEAGYDGQRFEDQWHHDPTWVPPTVGVLDPAPAQETVPRGYPAPSPAGLPAWTFRLLGSLAAAGSVVVAVAGLGARRSEVRREA